MHKSTEKCDVKISSFRRILPQVIATSVKNLLYIEMGITIGFPTIIIPALTGIQNAHNQNEFLSITAEQATWIGSISLLTQLLGCLLSIPMTDTLGRKKSMILVQIPFALGCFMIQGDTFWRVCAGIAILGLSEGMSEASIMTYLGEISHVQYLGAIYVCRWYKFVLPLLLASSRLEALNLFNNQTFSPYSEPKIRGVLIGVSNMSASVGMFMLFTMNNLMAWRSAALVCMTLPFISAIAICFIPETAQWLLSKNRSAEAEKSLRWLRGWVPSELVRKEFDELQKHAEHSKSCIACIKQDVKCIHPLPTLREKCAELKRKQTIKPFIIVILMFLISQFAGILTMRPYFMQIFKAYDSPLPPDQTTTLMSFLENLSSLIFIPMLPCIGKRRLYLFTMAAISICSAIISLYGFIYLPVGYISFDQETFHLEDQNLSYIPIVCISIWSFVAFCGCIAMPWMLISEIFPFKCRSIASSIAGATYYFLSFMSIKTYYAVETKLSLPGTTLFYCIVSVCGFILMYLILPETEGRTLEDIEMHFSDNSKKITDHKIVKSKHCGKRQEDVGNADN